MLRICLCLLIAAASASVAARELKNGDLDGAGCPNNVSARKPAAVRDNPAPIRPARESKLKPSVHSDAPGGSRLQPQRWHSLLPGMFR